MAKVTPRGPMKDTIVVKTQPAGKSKNQPFAWWKAQTKQELCDQLLATASFLKEQGNYKQRQASIFARLYGNMPLAGWVGSNFNKMGPNSQLPLDRPTMSVITSCIDTLVSRITQARPRPLFLTDGADYKQRSLSKQVNNFTAGEFYQTKAYQLGELMLRDASVLGTGCLKILERDNKVMLERKLMTELLVDAADGLYGDPRQMYELRLVDRDVLQEMFPKYRSMISAAEQGYPDSSSEYTQTSTDQVIVAEGWHLPSGKDAGDGRHTIACSSGVIFDEGWTKDRHPFVFMHYSPRLLGFWGQGLAEQLMGTQVEINKLLMTISQSINLVGVPRIFVEDGSKVVKSHFNNMVGSIITYRGTKPLYEVAPCVPAELYQQLQRLVEYAYQQSGVSALAATSQKPAGLNSGEALRNYDDLQSDRFAALNKRYTNFFIDLAYQITDKAVDICEREGEYQTVYPNKNGAQQVDLPEAKKLRENPFVFQCFDSSSLPRDPAGRLQKVTEMMQAGIVSPQEGRRLLDYPDIEQVDKLENASEERILKILDEIVEDGTYSPPDPMMDLQLATKLATQYYNLYAVAKLEEEKAQMIRDFFSQTQALITEATQPQMGAGMPGGQPMAAPMPQPQSDMVPNGGIG